MDRILRKSAVLDALGISNSEYYRRLAAGKIDPPIRLGPRSVGHFESYVTELQKSMVVGPPDPHQTERMSEMGKLSAARKRPARAAAG